MELLIVHDERAGHDALASTAPSSLATITVVGGGANDDPPVTITVDTAATTDHVIEPQHESFWITRERERLR
ncbi:MAG: hypothetical protein ACREPX_03815 [Rhodanobacteraceae bacterium]